jgi:predicted NAD-dependent protein-ADP-ribosyltransferase YbiA (DUF1768 family)
MKVMLKSKLLIVVPETDAERGELAAWKEPLAGHVLLLRSDSGEGAALVDLGSQADACNEPLNVISTSTDPALRLISNFAATPFVLDGRPYASVEGFWQGLKYPGGAERRRIAALSGGQAREAGEAQPYGPTITYEGQTIPVGTWGHWQLMERACLAKFTQHEEAQLALLSTGERTLVHRVRRDSRTIPGVIMADIWMKIRRRLQEGTAALPM